MREPTRPLPSLIPLTNGGWEVNSFLSSTEYTIRGLGLMPPNTIVPIIVVPGMMGTNLRAKRKPIIGKLHDERNVILRPGAPAWRPPNGKLEGLKASSMWDRIPPGDRQRIFDLATLEVDDSGPIFLPDAEDGYVLAEKELRERGWGEVYADAYGALLHALQTKLNQTFISDDQSKQLSVQVHWKEIMAFDSRKWGVREFPTLTETDLKKHAKQYYPVYGVGYNWLDDCEVSAKRLQARILQIIDQWRQAKRQCEKVILVTHSMGGLVARACAKCIPGSIAGIIHGAMPAHGAPVAYRRISCGTESSSPSNGGMDNYAAGRIAEIIGNTPSKTMPVLAVSPGALTLLPNHLYPGPWLNVRVTNVQNAKLPPNHEAPGHITPMVERPTDYLKLPSQISPNPYDLYRDMRCWYRLVDPALVDPARKYASQEEATRAVVLAIDKAERFHRTLGDFYHPNTYVFYGDDVKQLSFGQVRWTARQWGGASVAFTMSNIANGELVTPLAGSRRRVMIEGKTELLFDPERQDSRGDGTVPHQSSTGLPGKVKQVFAAQGFEHQGTYNNSDMLMLTLRLVAKIVQEMS